MEHAPQPHDPLAAARLEIGYLREQAARMGANDSEIPTINRLLGKMENGEPSPEEALRQAHAIVSAKQDYH